MVGRGAKVTAAAPVSLSSTWRLYRKLLRSKLLQRKYHGRRGGMDFGRKCRKATYLPRSFYPHHYLRHPLPARFSCSFFLFIFCWYLLSVFSIASAHFFSSTHIFAPCSFSVIVFLYLLLGFVLLILFVPPSSCSSYLSFLL